MALALLAFLLWLLHQWNTKTPIVFITATKYEDPIPLNPWAVEDRNSLQELKAILSIPERVPDWNEASGKLEVLPKSLDFLVHFRKESPLLLYLSVHGVVKEDGEPCLLPPGASINDPKRWVPVANVLDEINEKVPASRNVVLILDSNRIRVNWNLGILYNTFTERVSELVERKKIPRLVVLTSAGPGQVNGTSAEFGGSVFARYLQLGLAGAADSGAAGNHDDDISLQELVAYLQHEVNAWSLFNRGEPQQPTVVPHDANLHIHVAYALAQKSRCR